MSQEPQSYADKKQYSIVHKPFSKGQINIFNPQKKYAKKNLVSAKLSDKDISQQLFAPELLKSEVKSVDYGAKKFLNTCKISAIGLVVLGNIIAATTIFIHKQKVQSVTSIENNQHLYVSGKSDLATQEFVELNLNNLKNIAESKTAETKDFKTSQNDSLVNLPLAIPPTNLPPDIIIPEVKENSQYYYILTSYTGDRSLELAKTKVPHVSLVNFPQGVFIYMGAFAQKESALKFITQLKELGLEGYIYPFE